MKAPIVSLALARCPLPHHRERTDLISAHGKLPGGAAVKCVVATAADSSIGVLDAATGYFLSR